MGLSIWNGDRERSRGGDNPWKNQGRKPGWHCHFPYYSPMAEAAAENSVSFLPNPTAAGRISISRKTAIIPGSLEPVFPAATFSAIISVAVIRSFQVKSSREDCLVLNVLTPGLDDKKRPVLVYIHGGGFATGSGTLVLGADKWAREEDLVVVGINHRLNIFGYLYLGGLDETAWNRNGRYTGSVCCFQMGAGKHFRFWRRSDQVTIMGESGGGMKVSTLMAMPEAKGLFSKAIVESGSKTVGHYSRESAAKITEHVLEALHLSKENWKEILSIPAEELLKTSVSENDPSLS